jgi:diaminohydroxyphosphoribosylaminopyrimidine deaminase/5-amino-6-(5-phosphoribosylamino)uracil reductase
MRQALELAQLGLYSTSPNPRVGCVIVKDGRIVGEGWHQKAGEPHAEINALRMAGEDAKDATAYVTLEPCSHYGRTPPCADALIKAGVARVVGACSDPNPSVAGRGYRRLRDAGIEVVESCLATDAETLNIGFMKRMRTGRPYVRIKLAQSLDGRTAMASGESQWITGPQARQDVQKLRARSCAVITGADSVLIDDPSMTVRPAESGIEQEDRLWRQPLRVLIDGQQRVTGDAKLFALQGDILIATRSTDSSVTSASETGTIQRADNLGTLEYWHSEGTEQVNLAALLDELGQRGCNEVLVESGARLAGAFIEQGLVDELVLYCAPTLLGSDARPLITLPLTRMKEQIRWQWQDVQPISNDIRLILTPASPGDAFNSGSNNDPNNSPNNAPMTEGAQ